MLCKASHKVGKTTTTVNLGVGLAMDAFSVSLANGLEEPDMKKKKMCGIAGQSLIMCSLILFNNNVVDNKNEQFCRIRGLFQGNFVD